MISKASLKNSDLKTLMSNLNTSNILGRKEAGFANRQNLSVNQFKNLWNFVGKEDSENEDKNDFLIDEQDEFDPNFISPNHAQTGFFHQE